MESQIKKWGNSQGLRLSLELLRQVEMAVGDEVVLTVQDQHIVIRKKVQVPKRRLADIVAEMPPDYRVAEENFGPPVGLEEW